MSFIAKPFLISLNLPPHAHHLFCPQDPVGNKDAENPPLYFPITYDQTIAAEYLLLWIFTLESLLKTVAYAPWGYFFGPDRIWNRLDFAVVLLGWLEEYPTYVGALPINLSFLRIFRVLRPLRTLSKIDGLKELIGTMFQCYDPLTDVLSLTIFIFFVFSVLGMELFQVGQLLVVVVAVTKRAQKELLPAAV
jgi:voltage-gated sodium channel